MLNSPSPGSAGLDPNTQRALEQLALIVSDVEQRLSVVKSTLAQLAPTLGNLPEGGPRDARASVTPQGLPNFYQAGVPTFGGPALGLGYFPQGPPQFGQFAYAPSFQGVSAPVIIPMGSMAPTFPFRLR